MRLMAPLLALLLAAAAPAAAQNRYAERTAAFARENARLDPEQRYVVLLGSSTMEGWRFADRVRRFLPTVGPRMLNRGISGDGIGIPAHRGILGRLKESVFDCQPSHVILQNGTNSLGYGVERTARVYEQVVVAIKERCPDAVLALVTCQPTRGSYASLRAKTVQLNERIREIARRHDCALIDLHPLLAEDDGLTLRRELTRDGLHFKDEGYRLLGERIERLVAEEPAPRAAEPAASEGLPLDDLPGVGASGAEGAAQGEGEPAASAGSTDSVAPTAPEECPQEATTRARLLEGLLRRLRDLF